MATTNGQTLSERQRGLAVCACLMAQGDLERLEPAMRSALDKGVTVNELKEAFSQLYAYTGFPRSLNALGVLGKVLQAHPNAGWQEGKPWTRPAEWDDAQKAYELGVKNQTQLASHKQGAVNMGNTQEQVDELCDYLRTEGYTLRSMWPKGESNPFGQFFIGQSYLAPMDAANGGPINVTFEPRCRNNWHIHHR